MGSDQFRLIKDCLWSLMHFIYDLFILRLLFNFLVTSSFNNNQPLMIKVLVRKLIRSPHCQSLKELNMLSLSCCLSYYYHYFTFY